MYGQISTRPRPRFRFQETQLAVAESTVLDDGDSHRQQMTSTTTASPRTSVGGPLRRLTQQSHHRCKSRRPTLASLLRAARLAVRCDWRRGDQTLVRRHGAECKLSHTSHRWWRCDVVRLICKRGPLAAELFVCPFQCNLFNRFSLVESEYLY